MNILCLQHTWDLFDDEDQELLGWVLMWLGHLILENKTTSRTAIWKSHSNTEIATGISFAFGQGSLFSHKVKDLKEIVSLTLTENNLVLFSHKFTLTHYIGPRRYAQLPHLKNHIQIRD